ncbi:hypothetical protein [Streptomyces millisiae]|uniref:Uncharacterized protein n=1 Tax=Streptomyces millisiae TaxID=3075542 RepID=A0ABU2M005_9ACTN|nr:hypothetical protein [Streptomyces sp. DSM 44918]MDT0323149.1 hypothetical protein [Streptomyces sp. DSM 44918]
MATPTKSADERQDYIDLMRDAGMPDMVRVCLYQLASRLRGPMDFGDELRVSYDRKVLAAQTGLDEEAVDLCIDIAAEIGWAAEVGRSSLVLREPQQDLRMWLDMLKDIDQPVTDEKRYQGLREAFIAETDKLRNEPMVTVRRLRQAAKDLGIA